MKLYYDLKCVAGIWISTLQIFVLAIDRKQFTNKEIIQNYNSFPQNQIKKIIKTGILTNEPARLLN